MEPNRTRQVVQDLARAFNKLASELTADLSYAAREIENLRKEVQRLKSSSGKSKTNGISKKSKSHGAKSNSLAHKSSRAGTPHKGTPSNEPPKPAHEPGSFVFPQEPFGPASPSEPTPPGNN